MDHPDSHMGRIEWAGVIAALSWRRVLLSWMCASVLVFVVILGYVPSGSADINRGSISGKNRWHKVPGGGVRLVDADYTQVSTATEGEVEWRLIYTLSTLRGKIVYRWYHIDIVSVIDPAMRDQCLEGIAVMLGHRMLPSLEPIREELRDGSIDTDTLDKRVLYEAIILSGVEAMVLALPLAIWTLWVLARRYKCAAETSRCLWCGHQLLMTQYRCSECGRPVITPEGIRAISIIDSQATAAQKASLDSPH
ncbi:MAG: hypothetical protein IPM33_04505 [Phycisphaerales bacterium]|nr:hypothetical protein [Phycisphaerales bacterium]